MFGTFAFTYNWTTLSPLDTWNVSNVRSMQYMFYASRFNGSLANWDFTNVDAMFRLGYFNESVENWKFPRNFYRFQGVLGGTFNHPSINTWDVSNLTSLDRIFQGCSSFNQPLTNWNVSNVQSMSEMFYYCRSFNQDLSSWNVSNVRNMTRMFYYCDSFNQPLNSWDVSNVGDMTSMFYRCSALNQSLSNWNTINVYSMQGTFQGSNVNQPLNTWNVSNVRNMGEMFNGSTFNGSLANWDVRNVSNFSNFSSNVFNESVANWLLPTNMNSFQGMLGSQFNNSSINTWDVSNVTSMDGLFISCSSLNQPLTNWNVSNVQSMTQMFYNCASFNQDLSSWNVSKVQSMHQMFFNCTSFNQNISSWNVSNVAYMSSMFYGALSFNQPLNSWDVSNVRNMPSMFCQSPFNQPLNSWNVSNVQYMDSMFDNCSSFNQDISSWNVSKVVSMSHMFRTTSSFNQPLNSWDVSNVRDTSYMFQFATTFNKPLNSWNVSNATNMSGMFYNAYVFDKPLSSWNTSNNRNFSSMFYDAYSFDQNIGNFSFQSSNSNIGDFLINVGMSPVNYTNSLLGWASQQNIPQALYMNNGDLKSSGGGSAPRSILTSSPNNWNIIDGGSINLYLIYNIPTSNQVVELPLTGISSNTTIIWGDGQSSYVTSGGIVSHTYSDTGIFNIYVSGQITAYGSSTNSPVAGIQYLTDVVDWDTGYITSMAYGFYGASSLTSVPSTLPTSTVVTDISYMFYGATTLDQNMASWNVSQITNMTNLFIRSGFSVYTYYLMYNSWVPQTSYNMFRSAGLPTLLTCFKEDTKICCFVDNVEKYVPIQTLKPGVLVKTVNNGYVKIKFLGRSLMFNPSHKDRIKDRLYRCSMENYSELFEDLYMTGAHSILVPKLSDVQREKTVALFGHVYLTDRRSRLMTYLDERSEPYDKEGEFTVWHFALEHEDRHVNYGVYANGLLVESASIRWMEEFSNMEIIN